MSFDLEHSLRKLANTLFSSGGASPPDVSAMVTDCGLEYMKQCSALWQQIRGTSRDTENSVIETRAVFDTVCQHAVRAHLQIDRLHKELSLAPHLEKSVDAVCARIDTLCLRTDRLELVLDTLSKHEAVRRVESLKVALAKDKETFLLKQKQEVAAALRATKVRLAAAADEAFAKAVEQYVEKNKKNSKKKKKNKKNKKNKNKREEHATEQEQEQEQEREEEEEEEEEEGSDIDSFFLQTQEDDKKDQLESFLTEHEQETETEVKDESTTEETESAVKP